MGILDEAVSLVPYSHEWPRQFAIEQDRIVTALGIPRTDIEHIGSTSVPGLLSKPIVDMMLGLAKYPPPQSLIDAIVALGYEDLGEEAGVAQRRYFRRRTGSDTNLHAVAHNGDHWFKNIALREYLRTSDSGRARYIAAKQHAIEAGARTLLSYSEAKAGVMAALIVEAMQPEVRNRRQ
jgi:GrpB-like predicted nucleotidyltransferase (UPF0157 family)